MDTLDNEAAVWSTNPYGYAEEPVPRPTTAYWPSLDPGYLGADDAYVSLQEVDRYGSGYPPTPASSATFPPSRSYVYQPDDSAPSSTFAPSPYEIKPPLPYGNALNNAQSWFAAARESFLAAAQPQHSTCPPTPQIPYAPQLADHEIKTQQSSSSPCWSDSHPPPPTRNHISSSRETPFTPTTAGSRYASARNLFIVVPPAQNYSQSIRSSLVSDQPRRTRFARVADSLMFCSPTVLRLERTNPSSETLSSSTRRSSTVTRASMASRHPCRPGTTLRTRRRCTRARRSRCSLNSTRTLDSLPHYLRHRPSSSRRPFAPRASSRPSCTNPRRLPRHPASARRSSPALSCHQEDNRHGHSHQFSLSHCRSTRATPTRSERRSRRRARLQRSCQRSACGPPARSQSTEARRENRSHCDSSTSLKRTRARSSAQWRRRGR